MKKIFVCLAAILVACGVNATTHKVKASQGAHGLDSVLNVAQSGDTILVQEGTYTGNFKMKEGVQVLGGWNGLFTSQKDYASVLDANASGRVLNQESTFATLTVWSNFTIQNGYLETAQTDQGAAGVFLNKKGRVQHCLIQNNKVITSISGNAMGGGVSCNSANADPDTVAYDCVIKNNSATHGGGVRVNGQGIVVYKCVIENNETVNNAAGGIQSHNGACLVNCIVRNNKANGDTGGVRLTGGNIATVINCLIVNNVATGKVGGLGMEGNLANIINNTIVGNNQQGGTGSTAGVKVNKDKSANGTFFCNNVVWGNMSSGVKEAQNVYYISKYDKTKGQRSYNAIIGQAGDDDTTGKTSLKLDTVNPGFKDIANGDYTLVSGSKLIDFGKDSLAMGTDLNGDKRIKGLRVDLGCYEAASKYVLVGQDLQAALDGAAKGDTLLVQAGTFVGNFIMRNGVNVSGGWNADFTEQTQYGTVLDGDAKDRVLTQTEDFDVLTVWDNVTLQNGQFDKNVSKPSTTKGGGVYLLWNSQLKNCLIQNNTYTGSECEGGGVAQDKDDHAGDVVLLNCVIKNNTASHGGGVYLRSTAVGCIITENKTTGTHPAGGAHLQWGRLYNCQVTKNHSSEDAGGIRAYGNCKVIGCLVADNTCDGKVAGICIENALGELVGNTIVNNKQAKDNTDQEYCGVRFDSSSDRGNACCNNIIYGNKAGETVWAQQCSSYITKYKTGIIGNNAIAGAPSDYADSLYINIKDIKADSLFTNYAEGDYTLAATAPMINAGNMSFSYAYDKDLAGNDRVQKGIVDMGCYESAYDTPVPTTIVETKSAVRVNKKIVNGQVVVVKDGVPYNVLGTKLQ